MTDKDFVWRDNYSRNNNNEKDKSESYENIRYETAIEELRKKHSRFLIITAVLFIIFSGFFNYLTSSHSVDRDLLVKIT